MTEIFPFESAQVITYRFLGKAHYFANSTFKVCTGENLREYLSNLIEKIDSKYKTIALKPQDSASNIELQLAFEGQQRMKLADRVLFLLK